MKLIIRIKEIIDSLYWWYQYMGWDGIWWYLFGPKTGRFEKKGIDNDKG